MQITQDYVSGYQDALSDAALICEVKKRDHAFHIRHLKVTKGWSAKREGFKLPADRPSFDEVFMCCVLSLALMAIVLVWGMQ